MAAAELGAARAALGARFGLESFRPGQERVVEALLAGRSALAVFPTGARQEPLLPAAGPAARRGHGRRLAADRADEGSDRCPRRARGIAAARLDSSLGADEARDVSGRLRAGGLKLLYVAPERFNNERFLAQLGQTADLAVRRRRGALHLRVGAQLPARTT